jgi:hypothetical protein
MDCFEYMERNGCNFWGKSPIDLDALDRGHGHDGTPIHSTDYLFDKKCERDFEEDQKRTIEEKMAINKVHRTNAQKANFNSHNGG